MIEQIIPGLIKIAAPLISAALQKPLRRNPKVIEFLKQKGWDPEHPPAEFGDIYAHAVVDYVLDLEQPVALQPLLKLLQAKDIQQAFRRALDNWDARILRQAMGAFLDRIGFGPSASARMARRWYPAVLTKPFAFGM